MLSFLFNRFPNGEKRLMQLIELIKNGKADTHEDHFLEVKSEFDFQNKTDRAKVAKFILGSSNRSPEQAAKKFEGRAVMLIGVGEGTYVVQPTSTG